jgi:C-terminal processing protease CtpA/Prc
MLNLDTVGRLDKRKILVLGAGSAKEWVHIFRGAGQVTGADIETVSGELDSSDQTSFHEAGVPAVQLFSGVHLDYHRPADTADRIDQDGLIKVASVAKEVVEYLAGRDSPLTSTLARGERGPMKPGTERKVSLGTIPDFAYAGKGVRLSGVVPGSPAADAGLQEGDVILRVNESGVANLREFSDILKRLKPGDKAAISVERDGTEQSFHATLQER